MTKKKKKKKTGAAHPASWVFDFSTTMANLFASSVMEKQSLFQSEYFAVLFENELIDTLRQLHFYSNALEVEAEAKIQAEKEKCRQDFTSFVSFVRAEEDVVVSSSYSPLLAQTKQKK